MSSNPARSRLELAVVAAAVAVHAAHQLRFRDWYIEDAAISFSYARNVVEGHGLVPWPGGERIEGYSNPLWVALIAAGQLVGVDGFQSSKWLALPLGAACVVMAWRLALRCMPDGSRLTALFAPVILAMSAHHALWSASGLENALFNALVLAGLLALLDDAEQERWPRSALWFLGAALTRPEGAVYAATAAGWFALWTRIDGRPLRRVAWWAALWGVPFALLEIARIAYFALPLPNTFYAKVVTAGTTPERWYGKGWMQIREYADRLWQGWFLPVYAVGLLGTRGWRGKVAMGAIVFVGLVLVIPGTDAMRALWFWPEVTQPVPWLRFRVLVITVAAVTLPFVALGTPGGRARALTWSMIAVAVGFAVAANGDWMVALRWMSLFVCEAAVLLAVGIDAVARWAAERTGTPHRGPVWWAVASLGVGLQAPPNLLYSAWAAAHLDDSPASIKRRVDHAQRLADLVFLDEPLRPLDMDMGAHLWWRGQHPVDMAGLVDLPMSLHRYDQQAFIQEYVFTETRPHVAHVHGGWADATRLRDYPEWKRTYLPYAGYADEHGLHEGLYFRRDLVMQPAWLHGADHAVGFARGVTLEGWRTSAPEAGAGGVLWIETGWSSVAARRPEDGFAVTLFLARGDRVLSWDLPMGYAFAGDPLVPTWSWRAGEVFVGRFAVTLPEDAEPGTWDLGFAVRGGRGFPLMAGGVVESPREVAPGAVIAGAEHPPRFSRGEVVFPGAVQVVPQADANALADADRIAALDGAWSGGCEDAEGLWWRARMRRPSDDGWTGPHAPEVAEALAGCWAERARDRDDVAAAALLAKAHAWDPRHPALREVGGPVADRLYAKGMAARADGDWQTAYTEFTRVLAFAPHRAWARRRAEEARDHRLGLADGPPRAW